MTQKDTVQRAAHRVVSIWQAIKNQPLDVLENYIIQCLENTEFIKQPIPMVLHCPQCSYQHIDKADTIDKYCITQADGDCVSTDPRCMHQTNPLPIWTNPPHKSHLCSNCKIIFRPASIPTVGVESIPRGEQDTWPKI